ncbi:hypothetical protein Spith_1398 [Spirochaeta thermophila DSM 6578]|uniref:Uncharacterized protein n=1 Tax=Winmispira thermophila (strain ATCC 700085 / DSM 6578 / Z-1203) TaxID=869211 RepID=G0GFW9_WINT7|nr:hypothetical protein [Spirochaeta thermophila]AEJ61662.1 hypothetical protein Spith_1398 [Spirochaeta thermophila DSM 6578]
MKLISVEDIKEKDHPLDYRKTYTARAVFQSVVHGKEEIPISFHIEYTPLGEPRIEVQLHEHPRSGEVLGAVKALKSHIKALREQGVLS